MKKIMIFAAMEAIAIFVAVNFGFGWMFSGILLAFATEYCIYTAYERSITKDQFMKKIANSRMMLRAHAAWCVCTLIVAAVLGLLSGFDMTVETQQGNTFEYTTVHQNGATWWILVVLLVARVVIQPFIEKAINENMKLAQE